MSEPLLQACNFIKKETQAQMFSFKFCEIFKNTSLTEHIWATALKKRIFDPVEYLKLQKSLTTKSC